MAATRSRRGRSEAEPERVLGDELFECPPARFVEVRTALTRRLRSEGDREGAAEVAARRRPTDSVWALNQVARQDPALVSALRTAGAELRAATEAALGGDASGLRPAQDAERRAVDAVVEAAQVDLATLGGPASAATRQRLVDTLRATSTDAAAASLLEAGRLTEDLTSAGLGLGGFEMSAVPQARGRRSSAKKSASAKKSTSGRARPAAAPAQAADATTKAEAARAERARARWAELDDAARQAEAQAQAQATEADQAGAVAEQAAAAAAKAQRAADQAAARAERARAKADAARTS